MEKYFEIQAEFDRLFPSEDSCIAYLNRLRWPGGFVCPRCGWREAWQIQPYKYKCKRTGCAYQVTPTAGTIFHRAHLPLKKWFWAAWYIAALGSNTVTASELHSQLELGSYHTALKISKSLGAYTPVGIKRLIQTGSPNNLLTGSFEVTGFYLPVKESDIPVILVQSTGTEPALFCARQSPDLSGESLVDFLLAHIAPGSIVDMDPVAFKKIGIQRKLYKFVFHPNYDKPKIELPVRVAAEKLKKEWNWQIEEKENSLLGEFLENYPSRQADPNGYRFNFERLIDSFIRKAHDVVL